MKHHVDVHVGKKIRQRRWLMGMTQQQLAECIGIKFQQVQKYETGMNRVSASRLWDISQALKAPVASFFEGIEEEGAEETSQDESQDIMVDKEALQLVRSYYLIAEEQRRRLFELTRSMAKLTEEEE